MEKYWSITCAYKDYNGRKFRKALKICIDFIDKHYDEPNSSTRYNDLQKKICKLTKISPISSRKAINQLVKLGFINSQLEGYNSLSKNYIKEKSIEKRNTLFSKIVHINSSFNRSVTNHANENPIKFLINTLNHIGTIKRNELIAIMQSDIKKFPKGFISQKEIKILLDKTKNNNFEKRKYNQIGYLEDLLTKLDGLSYKNKILKKEFDTSSIEKDDPRDAYLHSIFKNDLELESVKLFGAKQCMLAKLDYPILVASHIKPFKDSENDEKYDSENGLLLSRNFDDLFDKKDITFDKNGKIIAGKRVSEKLKKFLIDFKLDKRILTKKRNVYMEYHNYLFKKNNFSI